MFIEDTEIQDSASKDKPSWPFMVIGFCLVTITLMAADLIPSFGELAMISSIPDVGRLADMKDDAGLWISQTEATELLAAYDHYRATIQDSFGSQ